MPWRWNNWSHTYKSVINHNVLTSHPPIPSYIMPIEIQALKLGEENGSKSKMKKLKKRLEIVKNIELEQILLETELKTSQSPKPLLKAQKAKT